MESEPLICLTWLVIEGVERVVASTNGLGAYKSVQLGNISNGSRALVYDMFIVLLYHPSTYVLIKKQEIF